MEPEDIVGLITKKLKSQRDEGKSINRTQETSYRDQSDVKSRGRTSENKYYASETAPLRTISGSRERERDRHCDTMPVMVGNS